MAAYITTHLSNAPRTSSSCPSSKRRNQTTKRPDLRGLLYRGAQNAKRGYFSCQNRNSPRWQKQLLQIGFLWNDDIGAFRRLLNPCQTLLPIPVLEKPSGNKFWKIDFVYRPHTLGERGEQRGLTPPSVLIVFLASFCYVNYGASA